MQEYETKGVAGWATMEVVENTEVISECGGIFQTLC
jgi:hypothetical protein